MLSSRQTKSCEFKQQYSLWEPLGNIKFGEFCFVLSSLSTTTDKISSLEHHRENKMHKKNSEAHYCLLALFQTVSTSGNSLKSMFCGQTQMQDKTTQQQCQQKGIEDTWLYCMISSKSRCCLCYYNDLSLLCLGK